MIFRFAAVVTLLAFAGCVTKVATGPDGLPVGPATTTYEGPGAPVGGVQVSGPAPSSGSLDQLQFKLPSLSAPPPAALPPPANLTSP